MERSRRWVGLTTDSEYDAAALGQRIDAAAAAGTTRLHVFSNLDRVPKDWLAPLKAFVSGGRAAVES